MRRRRQTDCRLCQTVTGGTDGAPHTRRPNSETITICRPAGRNMQRNQALMDLSFGGTAAFDVPREMEPVTHGVPYR